MMRTRTSKTGMKKTIRMRMGRRKMKRKVDGLKRVAGKP